LELFDKSITLFNKTSCNISASKCHFLSNNVKKVIIEIEEDEDDTFEINDKSVTEYLKIINFKTIPIENLINMFKNIKILELKNISDWEVKIKINLP
jgi:hypothetical protein